MVYVMSDVHGQLGMFESMLSEICFSEDDVLYVLGDVIDRGEYGVEILQRIMISSNMRLIRGNHEQMCLDALSGNNYMFDVWMNNGGGVTCRRLMKLSDNLRHEILAYLDGLLEFMDIDVAGRSFYFVHAFPGETSHERLWSRPSYLKPYRHGDSTIILGHTPTFEFHANRLSYLRSVAHMEMFHGDGFIGIDCGCASPGGVYKGCLGCLRLDDMAEFYV